MLSFFFMLGLAAFVLNGIFFMEDRNKYGMQCNSKLKTVVIFVLNQVWYMVILSIGMLFWFGLSYFIFVGV